MNIRKFKAAFSNFQRSNLFRVEFKFKHGGFNPSQSVNMEAVSLLCKDAAFPFFTFNVAEVFYNGTKRVTAQQADYDPVAITMMIDSNGSVLNFIKEWSNVIKNQYHNFGFRDDYVCDVTISMLDQKSSALLMGLSLAGNTGNIIKNNVNKYHGVIDKIGKLTHLDTSSLDAFEQGEFISATVVLKNAFPVNIDEIPFSYESNDQISTVTMNLTYDYADYGMETKERTFGGAIKYLGYLNEARDLVRGGFSRASLDKILSRF